MNSVDKIIRDAGGVPPVDESKLVLTDGSPITDDHRELKSNGQQKGYVVLSADERKRGFVRPVRVSYRHVGPIGPKHPLRDLTAEEHRRYDQYGYLKYKEYPAGNTICGRFWTAEMLERKGCGAVTTMGIALAETYARKPDFYGGTFCCGCGSHFPVGAHGEFVWDGTEERVGT